MAGTVSVSSVQFNRIPAIARALTNDGDRIVAKTAFDVQAAVIESFSGSKTGRYYAIPGVKSSRQGGGGRRHRASAPGEAPARLTGALAGSVTVQRSYQRAVVGVSSSYGPHLEYGTVRMRPRPFLRPVARKFNVIFEYAVRAMLDRVTR